MPIYEYKCNNCKRIFEELQKISDPPVTKCRYCGSDMVSRIVSVASFSLKGSGWYMTDYANDRKNSPPEASKAKAPSKPDKTSPADSSKKPPENKPSAPA